MTKLTNDTLITPALLRRFELEAEEEGGDARQYYALIRLSDGSIAAHHPFSVAADPNQMMWAADVLKMLNTELHHDGAWVIEFTHPKVGTIAALRDPKHIEYRRIVLLWMDEDGDVQIPVEWVEGEVDQLIDFPDLMLAGKQWIGDLAESAWQQWYLHMRVVPEIKAGKRGQTFKRAKGERPSSAQN